MNQQNYVNIYDKAEQRDTFATLMKNVYLWMSLALAMTGLTAAYVAGNPGWMQTIFSGMNFWLLCLGELALVWYFSARIMQLSFTTAGILFAVYSILNGVTLSCIFMVYDLGTISSAFFTTAGTFGAMSLYGYCTKRDLSIWGRFLMMCLIGLLIATVVNWFVASSALYWGITYAGVLIFCGLTAYDTHKIKKMLQEHGDEVNESTMKLALLGSLELYLDFINLFIYMLRIFASSRD